MRASHRGGAPGGDSPLLACVVFDGVCATAARAPVNDEEPGPHREGRHGLARLARGQVEVPCDRRLAEDGAEPRLDDGAAPVRRAHGEAVADDGERRAAGRGRRHAGRLLDDAAAVEAQQRDAQRAVAVEHAERAVARAEGSAHDRRVRCNGRAALDGVDQALGREEGDAVARRALVGLVVREGDGAGAGLRISPAAGRVRRRSEGDSRGCYATHHPLFGYYSRLGREDRSPSAVLNLFIDCCAIAPLRNGDGTFCRLLTEQPSAARRAEAVRA